MVLVVGVMVMGSVWGLPGWLGRVGGVWVVLSFDFAV